MANEAGQEAKSDGQAVSRRRVVVRGVVQGVGFRPFVYRLATEEGLAGSIGNDTDGVTIEVEGRDSQVETFLLRLRTETPPLARVDSVAVLALAPRGMSGFHIISSQVKGPVRTAIPADAATCSDCLRELLDPADRRYRYPFLNCTNCGPRFTITSRVPYDRPQTSMAAFPMCAACQAEYDDPRNRRFHAQPNACWDCGPRVWLESNDGKQIAADDPIAAAAARLLTGDIVAMKGIGGFHLSADATNEDAVARLRERKHRFGKPLAIMVRDLAAVRSICEVTPEEETLLQSPARPVVLLRARNDNVVANSVAPKVPWLGVFLPYAPLQHLLFTDPGVNVIVMTSANLSEEPIATDNEEARSRLGNIADVFLMHNREILQRCDDSVAAIVDGAPQLIRRARGFVPLAVDLPFDAPSLLAVGGHLKSVFTLARGRFAYQSQHLGDLENPTSLEFFQETLAHLMHTFEITPDIVVHDMHPGYLSTTWARDWATERGLPLQAVQHHHAHVAACMAEHSLKGPVIGLSLDGTGFGSDGRVWGGEVLIAQFDAFERFGHLEYVPMPGGEAAIREPWRMALAHLRAAGWDINATEISRLVGASPFEASLLTRMIDRGVNTPLTSSCGRLFDAAAAVVLQCRKVDYEAQAAIELEGIAVDESDTDGYPMEVIGADWEERKPAKISAAPLWRELVADIRSGISQGRVAARFHAGVASAFIEIASLARSATGLERVVMTGGCMHNRRLARLLLSGLKARGFQVYQHRRVSPGDGGLSYGQAVVAAALIGRRSPIG